MDISDRVRYARDRKGWTQAQLARAVGVAVPSVSAWETGKVKGIRPDHLSDAAEALGVSTDWLASEKGPIARSNSSAGAGNAATSHILSGSEQAVLLKLLGVTADTYQLAVRLQAMPQAKRELLLSLMGLERRSSERRVRTETIAVERRSGHDRR